MGKLTMVGLDNGLLPRWCQAIIWTDSGILLIGPLGTDFSEILIKIQTFVLKKICLKMSSVKCCPFHLDLSVLSDYPDSKVHGANMGPTWVLSAPDGPHVGPMNFALRIGITRHRDDQVWVACTYGTSTLSVNYLLPIMTYGHEMQTTNG